MDWILATTVLILYSAVAVAIFFLVRKQIINMGQRISAATIVAVLFWPATFIVAAIAGIIEYFRNKKNGSLA